VTLALLLGGCTVGSEDALPDAAAALPDGGPGADAAPAGDAATEPEPDDPRRARVTGTGASGLNLRAGPGTEHEVLLTMPEGSIVDLLEGPVGAWYRVDYQGTEGWAHGDYLVEIDEAAPGGGGMLYLLPWTAETAWRVSQGHNGGSHTGNGAWAWDFALPEGTPLLARPWAATRCPKTA
jgi:hypothetical protein